MFAYGIFSTMDEYIQQLLAEMQMPGPAQEVVRNILDEPIPETVKRRLLKPLYPEKYRPPHGRTGRGRPSWRSLIPFLFIGEPLERYRTIKKRYWILLLPKKRKTLHSTRPHGPLAASCEDGRWMCLKGTPMVQTPGLS